MRAVRGMATVLAVATVVVTAGCTKDKNPSLAAPSTPAPTSASPSPTPSVTPTPSATPNLVTGPNAKFANDPGVQTFFAFRVARREALRRGTIQYAPYVRLTTSARRQVDAALIARMKREDIEVRGPGYFVVQGTKRSGANQIVIRVCEDDDEAIWVHRKTGKIAIPSSNRWGAETVRVVRIQGTWKVHSWSHTTFKCKGELRK